VVATPVGAVASSLGRIADHLRAGALVTDVASTKVSICQAADMTLAGRAAFVGGHPMAGDDQTGVANAREELFQDCVWVVTPSAASPPEEVRRVETFASALGARTMRLDPQSHDRWVAATSHWPHVAAAALVNAVWSLTELEPDARALAATGFRDTTRVAAGPADLWDDILQDNADRVAPAIDTLIEELTQMRTAIAKGAETDIHALLERARARRRQILR
jgi:prephenate dehydrogenase